VICHTCGERWYPEDGPFVGAIPLCRKCGIAFTLAEYETPDEIHGQTINSIHISICIVANFYEIRLTGPPEELRVLNEKFLLKGRIRSSCLIIKEVETEREALKIYNEFSRSLQEL